MAEKFVNKSIASINVNVDTSLTISDKTAARCMRLLEMWMDDNPDAYIECERLPLLEGGVKHVLSIKRRCDDGKE